MERAVFFLPGVHAAMNPSLPAIDRRTLLAAALAGPMLPSARLWAAPAPAPKLLVLFLRGAYDSASVLVPTGDFYAEARPTLALPRSGENAVIRLDSDWGLNPVLAETLLPLWHAGQLAFIPFAGTPDLSRSHFETQDIIEYGQPLTGRRPTGSGFMNRLAAQVSGASAMAFTNRLPVAFRGPLAVPNIVPANGSGRPANPRRSDALAAMYAGDAELGGAVSEGLAARQMVSEALVTEMATAGQGAVSANSFEGAARRIGRVMRGKPNLCFADVGGWDTHVSQGGALNFRLGLLGRGLAGFVEEIGPEAWQTTTVIVISEFGRAFRENGNRGTDHGHGTVFWMLGGGIRGGRILGEQVKVTAATLNQGRDYQVLNEIRAVLGGTFQRLYGLSAAQIETVFPGARPVDLKFV
jgi:uncharacterized protein (DUF1501 family)